MSCLSQRRSDTAKKKADLDSQVRLTLRFGSFSMGKKVISLCRESQPG